MLETLLIAFAVALDQLTKAWASNALTVLPGMSQSVIPGVLSFTYVENTGAAFSILRGQQWLFIIISLSIVLMLGYCLIRYRGGEKLITRIAISCIIGGALGNLIDRVLHGYVVDFINPVFVRFAVFNAADIFVTCGTILFIVVILFFSPMQRDEKLKEEEMVTHAADKES